MDVPKLVLGVALIAGYLALRLGWTYKREARRGPGKRSSRQQVESALLMMLGVVMLAGGLLFILMAMGTFRA